MKLVALLLLIAAGAGAEHPRDVDWRKVATGADRARLREWRGAWIDALAMVPPMPADVLFDPDRALSDATLPHGRYRCRTTKLGGRDRAARPVATGSWGRCFVTSDAGTPMLATDGPQRLIGHLFDDTDARQMFLGTVAFADERRAMEYGRDARRDAAGIVERIGERRWRLVLPRPAFESTLDIVEIVPAD